MDKKIFLFFVLVLFPFISFSQNAEDITIPYGFKVEKILSVNRCTDPQGLYVTSSGELIVASIAWKLYQVSPKGDVTTIAKFPIYSPKGPSPYDIVIDPQGTIYFTTQSIEANPGLYRMENGTAKRVTPEGWELGYIDHDNQGNFYCTANKPNFFRGVVKLTDSNGDGEYEVINFKSNPSPYGIAVTKNEYIYVVERGKTGKIIVFDINGNQIAVLASELNYPNDIALDSMGNIYTFVLDSLKVEGYGVFAYYNLLKITPYGAKQIIANDIKGLLHLTIDSDDNIYISEIYRGVISKIDKNGFKTDLTEDTEVISPADMAFDLSGRPYVCQFRNGILRRINPETKTSEPVTVSLGYTQTIATDDDGMFYLGLGDLFKVDPNIGSIEKIAILSVVSRTLRFDAYKRLIRTMKSGPYIPPYEDIEYTLGIFDFEKKTLIPYISGVKNRDRGFLFDKDQNLYVKHRRADGIIKVNIPEEPQDPPFNISGQPLLIDLREKDSEIRFFALNAQGQLLIPLVDTGEIIIGNQDGTWKVFASGFSLPGHAVLDKNGFLYVVDWDNGIFRIIGEEFVIPAVTSRLQELCDEINKRVNNAGIINSLCKKLENASEALKRKDIKPAINILGAFINEIEALSGKKIDAKDAKRFITIANSIIKGLENL